MTKIRTTKTNFTAGEISPRLLGRGDLRGYANGAASLRNMFVHPTGGVSRRAGLRFVDTARGPGRLASFEASTEDVYLLVFTDLMIDIYRDDILRASVPAPWTEVQLSRIVWVQNADTLFICHPEVPLQELVQTSDTDWTLSEFAFATGDNGQRLAPMHRFADKTVTLTPSGLSGSITLTSSVSFFRSSHLGAAFELNGQQVQVTSVTSTTLVNATVIEPLFSVGPTSVWVEQVFSGKRGYPTSASFHQNRLVLGGSRDLPNFLWFSKVGAIADFDVGTGLDDEAITFPLLSDQVNAVRALFSGRDLQVFTSGAEWRVAGEPLTPSSLKVLRQTRIGSCADCSVPPRNVDGATLFVSRSGRELREFIFAEVEQAYQANDLAVLSEHIFNNPVDQDYDTLNRLFHVVMADGSMATLTVFRAEQVTAWSVQETAGTFQSVAQAGREFYTMVARNGAILIERLDDGLGSDSAITDSAATPKQLWDGLDHLEGLSVTVLADGVVQASYVVSGGAITLDVAASAVEIGLPFLHKVEPLPPALKTPQGDGAGASVRLVRATFRVQDTAALRVDSGLGLRDVPFARMGDDLLDQPLAKFTGDKVVGGLGWQRDLAAPLWLVEQDLPLPCSILSVTTEVKVND